MYQHCTIKAPFFEIGPKSYLYGDDVVDLAKAADAASERYHVDIIFTTPIIELRRVKDATRYIHVFAPHMDPLLPGRGLADILPESLKAAGAEGVMLNHCEKPLTVAELKATILRADEVDLPPSYAPTPSRRPPPSPISARTSLWPSPRSSLAQAGPAIRSMWRLLPAA